MLFFGLFLTGGGPARVASPNCQFQSSFPSFDGSVIRNSSLNRLNRLSPCFLFADQALLLADRFLSAPPRQGDNGRTFSCLLIRKKKEGKA